MLNEEVTDSIKKQHPQKVHKLGLRLLTYVLSFSFFVSLATSAYILYSDYRQGTGELDRSIDQIQNGYQQSISYSLWNFDNQQIKAQLSGINNFPGVLAVYIETNEGLLHSIGNFDSKPSRTYAFDLIYKSPEREYPLGVLTIAMSFDDLYQELMYKAINIVATQFIKTFSVSLFILFIFQKLVTSRLQIMSDWAQKFNLKNLSEALVTRNIDDEPELVNFDEIDEVVFAINEMREILKDDIERRELTESELKSTQHRLSIAINNAELGFCEYNQQSNQLIANEHFLLQLDTSKSELEKEEQPIEWFKSLISGDSNIEQCERINQLLHGHMERICTQLTLQTAEHQLKHFDATIQVSEWEDSGLPSNIVFCLLDKTQEVNASRQATELNLSLEQKVAKRTEELSNEQIKYKARINKLEKALHDIEHRQLSVNKQAGFQPLKQALTLLAGPIEDSTRQYVIQSFNEYLDIQSQLECDTFDLVNMIREVSQRSILELNIPGQLQLSLPFSLMMDNYQSLISHSIRKTLALYSELTGPDLDAEALDIRASLHKDSAEISVYCHSLTASELHDKWQQDDCHPAIVLKMCRQLLVEHAGGEIELIPDQEVAAISISFSINIKPLLINPSPDHH